MRKVAFITGASRGIGKACAVRLAREGYDIVVAAKTVEPHPKLEGTIYTAAEEVARYGVEVLPLPCNVRDIESVREAAQATLERFGRVDVIINNAGALWWRPMDETPMNRFDLVMEVNARGAYAVTEAFLPAMKAQKCGHVIMMSPPVDLSVVPGHVAYMISKFGMTMIAIGLAEEMKDYNIRATALWPRTVIESYATINFGLGDPTVWRKADILADATWEILRRPESSNGRALIDEDFLREVGYTDFEQYKCVPDGAPLPLDSELMRVARS
ncbi:MAG TPA: SDR family oxidoreductase [Candidatus Hydrogenedentes bacterium]|nr:SDR family oxidoreductase [Candidatus Hydrogenedentota bacterium]